MQREGQKVFCGVGEGVGICLSSIQKNVFSTKSNMDIDTQRIYNLTQFLSTLTAHLYIVEL